MGVKTEDVRSRSIEELIKAARLPVVDLLGAKFHHVLVMSSQDNLRQGSEIKGR